MKKIFVLFAAAMLLCGCGENKKAKVESVTCEQKVSLMEEGAVLIDVRSASEYDLEHLDGAINIDYQVIGDKIEEQVSDKDKKIIVYCQSGTRSKKAADTLIEKGYTNVYDLGSIENCKK